MASVSSDRDTLPDAVRPFHYHLSIDNIEMGGAYSFHGIVKISAQVTRSCQEIVLNAIELTILGAEVNGNRAKDIMYDTPSQRVTLLFSEAIPMSDKVIVTIEYQGTVNADMRGFYRSKYKPTVPAVSSVPRDDEYHYHFSTQFEACEARRAFPCFDEPALKATFDLELALPVDQTALSNMPVKNARKTREGWQAIQFDTTPIMSTYLLVWAIGDFEYVEAFTKRKYNGTPLPFRIYTTRGMKNQGEYALQHGTAIIDYYSDLFDLEYPLPKVDCLAVHEFSHSAMENWGLVLYRAASLLCDEQTSDAKRQRIAYVLSHELAHQWFGNLVTMAWWSELWLNEGFADWVGWIAVDHLHPDWNVWEEYIFDSADKALQLDSLRSSHPIAVPVRDALEVEQVFDAISYLKGSSIIRMLADYIGKEAFLQGVSIYLKKHAYGNATTNDLWAAVSEASGHDVKSLIDPWILKMGYPVLTVAEEPGQISIRQSRFLSTGDVKPQDDTTTWWVPVGLRNGSITSVLSLTQKMDVFRDIDDEFYKLNNANAGFYRVNYPLPRLLKLGKQLGRLSGSDNIGLVSDASALAFAGEATTPALLAFIECFTSETRFYVWQAIVTAIGLVQGILSRDGAIASGLREFVLTLISPTLQRLGWEPSSGENYLTTQLRSLLLLTAGRNGHKEVITEAQRRFALYFNNQESTAIPANLRSTIYNIAIQHGGLSEYNTLVREWTTTTSADRREVIYTALGSTRDQSIIPMYLNFLFTSAATADIHFGALALADNPITRLPLWHYIRDNFEAICSYHGRNLLILDRLLRSSLKMCSEGETEKEISVFFEGRDTKGYDRTIGIIKDTIRGRAAYKEREGAIIAEWLKAHGYA